MRNETVEPAWSGDFAQAAPEGEAGEAHKRRFSRAKFTLPGRYLGPDGAEIDCVTVDISPGGITLKTARRPRHGTHIIAYIRDLGRMEGDVIRVLHDGFVLALSARERKIERLLAKIEWLQLTELGALDRRGAPRAPLESASVMLRTRDRREFAVELVDVSETGVAFIGGVELAVGDRVIIDARRAVVSRLIPGGAAVHFI